MSPSSPPLASELLGEVPGGVNPGGKPQPQQAEPQEQAAAAPPRAARKGPDYSKPSWAGTSSLQGDVAVELIVRGEVKERVSLDLQAHNAFLFGRAPTCDVVLEGLEPKASRFHCVLQCKEGSQELFVYDLGSSHGTVLNGRQLDPRRFEPLHVGSQLRFCTDQTTSCLAVLCGPADAMEEEGKVDLSAFREQAAKERAQLEKAMEDELQKRKEAKRKRLLLEAQKAAAAKAMAACAEKSMKARQEKEERDRQRLQEVTWGMAEDAVEEPEELSSEAAQLMDAGGELDLHKIRTDLKLTEKQEQLLQKAEQKKKKFANLNREKKRLEERAVASAQRAALAERDFDEGPGSRARDVSSATAEQLLRLEAKIEKVEEELSELTDKILLSLGLQKSSRASRRVALYDTSLHDDGDDFFDRTTVKPKPTRAAEATELIGLPQIEGVETCKSLEAKLKQLQAERGRVAAQIAAEKVKSSSGTAETDEDSLDAFMGSTVAELRQDRREKLRRRSEAVEARLTEVEAMLRVARRNVDEPLRDVSAEAPGHRAPPAEQDRQAPQHHDRPAPDDDHYSPPRADGSRQEVSGAQGSQAGLPVAPGGEAAGVAAVPGTAESVGGAGTRVRGEEAAPTSIEKHGVGASTVGPAGAAATPRKLGPERPSAALLAQAAAQVPQPARVQIDPDRAGLQLLGGPKRRRSSEGDAAAMPPPDVPLKERKKCGAALLPS